MFFDKAQLVEQQLIILPLFKSLALPVLSLSPPLNDRYKSHQHFCGCLPIRERAVGPHSEEEPLDFSAGPFSWRVAADLFLHETLTAVRVAVMATSTEETSDPGVAVLVSYRAREPDATNTESWRSLPTDSASASHSVYKDNRRVLRAT
ncbi:hypothetical protein ACJZ2D_005927 [Fusarium nematophilum]